MQTLSGVVKPDANAPYAQWAVQVCRHMAQHQPRLGAFTAADVPPDLAAQWSQWWPAHAVWLPVSQPTPGTPGSPQREAASAGLLLVGADPFPADRLPVLGEWCSMWGHAWRALQRRRMASPRQWWAHLRQQQAQSIWWRRPVVWAVAAVAVPAAASVVSGAGAGVAGAVLTVPAPNFGAAPGTRTLTSALTR